VKTRTFTRAALVTALTAGAVAATTLPAHGDAAPQAHDVVGVGSDIVQNAMDFLADGYGTNPGYNTDGNKNRVISFDATADGNGRNAFSDPALGTSVQLNPTVTLREGTYPVQRPNGGTAGLTAFLNDTATPHLINFVRSPSLPTSQQQTQATNAGDPLHSIEFAKDDQVIATASTTNAPSALSAQDLVNIYNGTYTKWSDVPGYTGTAGSQLIVPLIPQNGAGVQKVFLNALKAANNNTAITLAGDVRFVQQNDPTTITGLNDTDRPNAIVPFPVGRFKLLSDGYFHNPAQAWNSASPPASLSASGIKLQTSGTADSGANPVFDATLPYYIIFRESDFASTTPWQPGGTLNWVQELFYNPGGDDPWVKSAPAQAILSSIGLTPLYADKGNATDG
jgi:ABC-type phosphate transport system substrate-binding protein